MDGVQREIVKVVALVVIVNRIALHDPTPTKKKETLFLLFFVVAKVIAER